MTQYAYFNSNIAAPSPVIGWFDTGALTYPNLPIAADLLVMTQAQWNARLTGRWAVADGALVAYTPPAPIADTRLAAQTALTASDVTVIRCYEHGVAVPAAWTAYRTALRSIVGGTASTTPLPVKPAYPAGT